MADENLSFAVVFEEVNRLVNGVRDATAEIAGMKDAATAAAQGLDDAARSALAGADAFSSVATAASEAGGALQDIPTSVDLAMDPEPLERTATAAEGAAAEINGAVTAAQSMKSEGELAADAMQALGFATEEEAKASRLASDALDALAGNVGQVGDATKEAAAATTSAARGFSQFGSIAKASAAIVGGLVAIKTASDVGRFIQDSMKGAVREFLEAERATTQLSAALASMNKFSSAAVSSVRAFASEIQRTTTFTDDAVVSAAALIAQVGQLSGPALQRATQAAVELSAVLGRDLNQAALLIARGAQGATESFSRLGIVIRGGGTDAEKFDRILDQIATKFGGRARAEALSFGGAIQQLRNSWNEFLETVGGSITIFEPTIRRMIAKLREFNEALGIETPGSAFDATAAIQKIGESFNAVQALTSKGFTVSKNPLTGFLQKIAAPDIKPIIDRVITDMQKALPKTLTKIEIAVEGMNKEEIAAFGASLDRLEAQAKELGSHALFDIAQQMQTVFDRARKVATAKIELQGIDKTVDGLQEAIDLAVRLRSLSGAGDFEIMNTARALEDAHDIDAVRRSVEGSVDGIEKALNEALAAGEAIPTDRVRQMFETIDEARRAIVEKYGRLPSEIEKIFSLAEDRLFAQARRFNIPVMRGPIISQDALDDLLHFAGQMGEELKAFGDLIRATNAAADADPLTVVNTDNLIAEAKTIEDLIPIYDAAFARLEEVIKRRSEAARSAREKALLEGGEVPSVRPAEAALGPRQEAIRRVEGLTQAFGGLSEGAEEAFKNAIRGAEELTAKYPEIDAAAVNTQETVTLAGIIMARGLEAGFAQILQGVESFSEGLKTIFKSVVDSILAELARIAATELGKRIGGFFLNLFVPGLGVAWDTALVGLGKATAPTTEPPPPIKFKTPKIEIPDLPPIDLPPLKFAPFELPKIELPQIEFPQAELRKLTLPRIETQPIETERFLFPTIEAAPTEPASVEFSRFLSSQATREAALSRESARIRRLSRERPIERIQPQFNIQATDALSVRRQLTAGALRREMERALRRSDF